MKVPIGAGAVGAGGGAEGALRAAAVEVAAAGTVFVLDVRAAAAAAAAGGGDVEDAADAVNGGSGGGGGGKKGGKKGGGGGGGGKAGGGKSGGGGGGGGSGGGRGVGGDNDGGDGGGGGSASRRADKAVLGSGGGPDTAPLGALLPPGTPHMVTVTALVRTAPEDDHHGMDKHVIPVLASSSSTSIESDLHQRKGVRCHATHGDWASFIESDVVIETGLALDRPFGPFDSRGGADGVGLCS
jgi:hypothetical protein